MLRPLGFYLHGAALISVVAAIAFATQALGDSTGALCGHIYDIETQPLSDAQLRLVGDNSSTYRGHGDKRGYYAFIGVEPGIYRVEFRRNNYRTGMEYGVIVCPSGSTMLDTWLQSVQSYASWDRFFFGHSLTTYGLRAAATL